MVRKTRARMFLHDARAEANKSGMGSRHGAVIVATRGPCKGIIAKAYNEYFCFRAVRR